MRTARMPTASVTADMMKKENTFIGYELREFESWNDGPNMSSKVTFSAGATRTWTRSAPWPSRSGPKAKSRNLPTTRIARWTTMDIDGNGDADMVETLPLYI